jgi:plastocyanin
MRYRSASALLVAAGLAIAGCGGDDSSADTTAPTATTTTSSSPAVMTDKVDIADFKFDPETIEVAAGTKVTWTNSDDAAHTATADDSSFDTGDLNKGDSAAATFDEPGELSYYCRFHPFMKATVEVK